MKNIEIQSFMNNETPDFAFQVDELKLIEDGSDFFRVSLANEVLTVDMKVNGQEGSICLEHEQIQALKVFLAKHFPNGDK